MKEIKNKISQTDAWLTKSWFKKDIINNELSNYHSMMSAAVKISTKGRFDDKERFNKPMEIEFIINNMFLTNEWSSNKIDQETFITYWNMTICLAYKDTYKKEWVCINRSPVDINKPNPKVGKPNETHAGITYKIGFPGTYAVIYQPVPNFALKVIGLRDSIIAKANLFKAASWKSNIIAFGTLLILIIMFGIYISAASSGLQESKINKKVKRFRWNVIMNTEPDYKGQGVLQKLEETVRFFNNPLRNSNPDDTEKNIEVNSQFDTKLQYYISKNKEKLGTQMMIQNNQREVMETKMQLKGDCSGNCSNDTSLNTQWFKAYAKQIKMSGNSLWGPGKILTVDEAVLQEDNEE